MEKFFEGEEFTLDEIIAGINQGVKDLSLVPVFCGSAMTGMGTESLIRGLVDFAPNPTEGYAQHAVNEKGEDVTINCAPTETPVIFVFKTVSDQYGKQSYFKVISGNITADLALENARTGDTEKLGHIYTVKGKKATEVKELCCGDIGMVSKLTSVKTGDTLCQPGRPLTLDPIEYHEPCHSRAIYAKVKGQEEKIASGLARLAEEDQSFTLVNNPETKEMVLTGAGDIHLDVLCSKLKSKFGVDCELREPKVAYRETIRNTVQFRGRHKKQSGGHGQFGDVVIEFAPGETEELTFEEKVVGGAVPKNFFPAVEKGLRESCEKGVLAGYPMVFLKATLLDGSYHPVDSSEMAFKTAASLAYKELGIKDKNGKLPARPVILEPIGSLKVTIPDAMMGDIMGDLNKRRGRVLGMTPNADGDQDNTDYLRQIQRLVEQQNAQHARAYNAHAGPHRIRRAERYLLQRRRKENGTCDIAGNRNQARYKLRKAFRHFHRRRPCDFKNSRQYQIDPLHDKTLLCIKKYQHPVSSKA